MVADETVGSSAAEGELTILSDSAHAAALLDPERRRLVEALRAEPDSASGLARRLGESRQRLNYHLRTLEQAGVLELHERRRRRNFEERVLRPTARQFVIDPAALGELAADPPAGGDRFSATYLIALAARTIRELAGLRERAARERKRLATASIETEVVVARPADYAALVEDLTRAVADVVARHHDEGSGGRPFRVVAGVYQKPTAAGDSEEEAGA